MRVTASDWIPRYEYYGISDSIRNVLPKQLEFSSFVEQVNIETDQLQKGLLSLSSDMMTLLINDLYSSGKLKEIRFDGMPPTDVLISREPRPTDLGQDTTSIWFGTPDAGNKEIMWYVDGVLKLSEIRNLATDRSVLKTDLDVSVGNVVQISSVDSNNLVSWWEGIVVD